MLERTLILLLFLVGCSTAEAQSDRTIMETVCTNLINNGDIESRSRCFFDETLPLSDNLETIFPRNSEPARVQAGLSGYELIFEGLVDCDTVQLSNCEENMPNRLIFRVRERSATSWNEDLIFTFVADKLQSIVLERK